MFNRCFILLLWLAVHAGAAPATSTVRGTWLGQDGHDFCQTSSGLAPNDIQDLHLRLEGLSPEPITSLIIRRNGGGEWAVVGPSRSWRGHLVREPNFPTADVYLEPSHNEEKCRLDIELKYASGQVERFSVAGGRSNYNTFMPRAVLGASWIGQDTNDFTGPGPAVGPDGFQDVRLELTGLSTLLEIGAITVQGTAGARWEYGLNPSNHWNAELVRDNKDKLRGSLYFSPDRDMGGEKLNVRITYKIDRTSAITVPAMATNPKLAMPPYPDMKISRAQYKIQWLGQDCLDLSGPGDIHVVIDGLPAEREIWAVGLSDPAGGYWVYRRDPSVKFYPAAGAENVPTLPLVLRREAGSVRADLVFPPYRDETAAPMMLRLLLDDGTTWVQQFTGGTCDPYLRGPKPGPGIVDVKPGDDLHGLVAKAGTIRLSPGRYVLNRSLMLSKPITITGPKDAVLAFTQTDTEPPWAGAVQIGASHVTLRGFSVRFAGNFRWDINGRMGAALIRTYDKPGSTDPRAAIVLENLDVESSSVSPLPEPAKPLEAPYLVRLPGATSGKIKGNRFRGAIVDVYNGPWEITNNEHQGTLPGTIFWDAFGGHWLHDFKLESNRVYALQPSGKTWRFFTVNQLGYGMVIRRNNVSGVGMRDNDPMPNPNAPEILLTESYRLYYEGAAKSVSNDGWVLQIPRVMYSAVRPGSIVSILSGPNAGEYFPIAQPLAPTAFLMAEPLPKGEYAVSIAHGFVDGIIEGNRIDVRGGSSVVMVLAGGHWNFKVVNNHLFGGGDSLLVQSTPTENPNIWGWSHTPFMGFLCADNIHEDSLRGVSIDVHSNRYNKTSAGRTYLTGIYTNNVIHWNAPMAENPKRKTEGIRIGGHSPDDPVQMKLQVADNAFSQQGAPSTNATLSIRNATVNDQPVREKILSLPSREIRLK